MLREFIQRYLGLTNLQKEMQILSDRQQKILNGMKDAKICLDLAIQSRAMGRIISKIDPMYGVSEFDPERRAASDKLSDEIIAKLQAEHTMSNRIPK